jgi:hypothetical protein
MYSRRRMRVGLRGNSDNSDNADNAASYGNGMLMFEYLHQAAIRAVRIYNQADVDYARD